ncbi:MAG: transketolase C-terminal domain-containing protein [Chlamydiales bacterium]
MTNFKEAILEATDQLLLTDERVYLMGLGVPDPKGIFGTTVGLQEKYGVKRVMDMPCSENTMTGVAIGSALVGMRPIMTHQRVDFFLLALDQLINNAAKWHFMFGSQMTVPLVIRLIIGRGWGQGPQHSQTFHSFFAHIPGLKVVVPSSAYDAKGLLISAVEDDHPVIYLEHRWLHHIQGHVPSEIYRVPIGQANILRKGEDLTLIASAHMTLEAYKAAQFLDEVEGISVEVIDLRSLKPLDTKTILISVRKTGRAIIADDDWKTCGISAEIMALLLEEAFDVLKSPPKRITYPDKFCGTSWKLANDYYPTDKEIVIAALEMMNRPSHQHVEARIKVKNEIPMDVPDALFTGPF